MKRFLAQVTALLFVSWAVAAEIEKIRAILRGAGLPAWLHPRD
jgi:hypothetical protein